MNHADILARVRLRDEFPLYAQECLRIRTKSGEIHPFAMNRAQWELHRHAEDQMQRTGRVRLIVLKGRQQGASTYIGGRAYWKTTHRQGWRTYILTHEQAATENLFAMTRRYHENVPEFVRPKTTSESAKSLKFGELDSDYAVGTAGSKGTGRSSTVQFFHGSEVGFWDHGADHIAGILQAVPDEPDTEVWLESTANGIGNIYHRMWQDAQAGIGDFEAVFLPWYWQEEYVREAVALEPEEDVYAERFELSGEQMAWRRAKTIELKDAALFRQEYPTTAIEAFMTSDTRAFLDAEHIEAAMTAKKALEPIGPKVLSLDVARFGDDRNVACLRQGRVVHWLSRWSKVDTMETVGKFKKLIDEHSPDAVFIDVIGVGAGVVDRLTEMGYDIRAAGAANKSLDPDTHINKRAEMYSELRDWLADAPVHLPDSDELKADLLGIQIKRFDSKGRVQLETKDEAKARGIRSPDCADALALTFFEPVALHHWNHTRHYVDNTARSRMTGY